ncbi:MAG: hypothetical protein ACOWWM_11955 [Desulfobacterales bacterium]
MRTLIAALLMVMLPVAGLDAADEVISYEKLRAYLPENISGYQRKGDSDGATFSSGDMHYSSAEQTYVKGDSVLTVVIADYASFAIMFEQSTSMWNSSFAVETPEQKAGSIDLGGYKGWEVIDKTVFSVEVVAAKQQRFLVTLSEENQTDTAHLKPVAKAILDKLPE